MEKLNQEKKQKNNKNLTIIITCTLIGFIFVLIIVGYFYKKRKKNEEKNLLEIYNDNLSEVEIKIEKISNNNIQKKNFFESFKEELSNFRKSYENTIRKLEYNYCFANASNKDKIWINFDVINLHTYDEKNAKNYLFGNLYEQELTELRNQYQSIKKKLDKEYESINSLEDFKLYHLKRIYLKYIHKNLEANHNDNINIKIKPQKEFYDFHDYSNYNILFVFQNGINLYSIFIDFTGCFNSFDNNLLDKIFKSPDISFNDLYAEIKEDLYTEIKEDLNNQQINEQIIKNKIDKIFPNLKEYCKQKIFENTIKFIKEKR